MKRVRHYHFHELSTVERKFQKTFGVSFKPFYDGIMSVVSKHLVMDIVKFDDWLHNQFGDYEDKGQSMKDIVLEKYGEDAEKLILSLIG